MKEYLYPKKFFARFYKKRRTNDIEYKLSSGIVLDKFDNVINIWTINFDSERTSISCPICEKEFDIGNNNMEDFHYCPNCGNPIRFLLNKNWE